MAEDTQAARHPHRGGDHVGAAANPEQHLLDAHNLSIRLQGKEGPTGRAVWSLVREEQGKAKTLTVFEGTRREAASRFYHYIHPNEAETPAAPVHRPKSPSHPAPRTGRPVARANTPPKQR